MPGFFGNAARKAKHILTIGELIATVGTAPLPPVVKANSEAQNQYKNYTKQVRMPETRRDAAREARKAQSLRNAHQMAGALQLDPKTMKPPKQKK
ncbi:hypothetical protein [Pseudoclavibacter helvolus]|uniref:hypothetical protein n=1 Tax=Pseudoclavibacter helvolus TaxID=255205 RepID=UPI00373684D2